MEGKEELKLGDYTVGTLPTLIYIPNFITNDEQHQLLHHIYEVPESRWKTLKNRRLQNWGGVVHEKGLLPQQLPAWLTNITERICKQTGLFPSAINHVLINEYLPHQGIMPHQDGPAYFPVVAILSLESPVVIDFTPHARLMNCKDKCSDKKHEDANTEETDTSSSELTSRVEDELCSLLLMPRSLLIFKDRAYSDYLHGIMDSDRLRLDKVVNAYESSKLGDYCSSDEKVGVIDDQRSESFYRTKRRVSLTCRLVHKVHRNLFKF